MAGSLTTRFPIPTGAGCSYGNVTFNATCRTRLTTTPKYDDANRTIVGLVCRLVVVGFISPGDYYQGASNSNIDAGFLTLALNQDGQRLVYYGLGGGNFDVGPGAVPGATFLGWRELSWGPKPKLLSIDVLGGGQAARFTWEVEWEMAKCQLANGGVYSWTHDVDYAIDQGMTTRTINGQITIPQQRVAADSRIVIDNVDSLLEFIEPARLIGWERKVSRNLTKDRRTLNYTFTDRQIGGANAYPPGVKKIDVKAGISSAAPSPGLLIQWIWRLSGSVTMHQDQNASLGVVIALSIMKQRVQYMAQQYRVGAGLFSMGTKEQGKVFALPIRVNVVESLYNEKTTDFEFALMIVLNDGNLQNTFVPIDFIARSGLYQNTGSNWNDWFFSTRDVYSARGLAERGFTSEFDRLVDVCDPALQGVTGGSGGGSSGAGGENQAPKDSGKDVVPEKEEDPKVPEEEVGPTDEDEFVEQVLADPDFLILTPKQASGRIMFYREKIEAEQTIGDAWHTPSSPDFDLLIQNVSLPTLKWVETGKAICIGSRVYKPMKCGNINGFEVEQTGVGGCTSYDGGNLFGIGRVTVTEWYQEYRAKKRPDVKNGATDSSRVPVVPKTPQGPDGFGVTTDDSFE